MHRRRDRYLRRRSALLQALVETGLMPVDAKDARALAGCDPYDLRKRGLDERLEPHEIGRALFHLNQRHGFKSNSNAERQSDDDKENGKISNGAKALDIAMEEDGSWTYGEFLTGRKTKPDPIQIACDGQYFYPERRQIEPQGRVRFWR